MSSPTDQQLIQFIGQGRRDALAQLFDRYSADLYDYLARLVGDRDQAARLLQTVMLRVPGAAAGFQPRDSVRGWLYSLSREAGLDWLRQRGWLDGLPPSDEPLPPGLQGDVWKAARAMPAFFRAVLITEELHPLSPSEKARALGVNRTDLPRLIDEARRSFNRIYDAQARAEGRPTSDRIDPDTVWNARRRLPVEGGSLFGFLPVVALPESLGQQIRRHVVEAMSPSPTPPPEKESAAGAAAVGGAAAAAMVAGAGGGTPPPAQPPAQVPPPQPVGAEPQPAAPPRKPVPYETQPASAGRFGGLPTTAIAALIGVALALLLCAGVFLLTQNRSKPSITFTQPLNGQTIQQTPEIDIFARYSSERPIDQSKSAMQIDGRPVTPFFISDSIAWTGPLTVGAHTVSVVIADTAGGSAEQTWTFFVVAAGTLTPPLTGEASVTPLASVTPIVPVTADVTTITPIFATPTQPAFITVTPPPPPTFFPPFFTPTTCSSGSIVGLAFNDLNGNGQRDPNEPGLAGVVINLTTLTNSVLAVAVSDSFGNYRFNNVPFGQYRVVANTPAGWFPTTVTTIPVNIFGCGTVSGFNFGFAQAPPPVTPTWTPVTPIVVTATFTPTPSQTVPPPFFVTNANAFVSPVSSTTCPQTFTFNGSITTNGAGVVTYQWVRSDGAVSPAQSLTFLAAGTQNVPPETWTLGAPGFNFSGWERIQVLAPNNVSSPQANFTLNCIVPTTPTDTPTPTSTPTTPAPPFAVTAANAMVSPTNAVACPANFSFNGSITVTGTGVVTYQWQGSDSFGNTINGPASTLTFLVPGTQNLSSPYVYTIPGPGPLIGSGGAHIHVMAPNVFDSPDATFTLNCP